MSKKVKFAKNSIIYFRGEEASEIFLISEGEVQVTSNLFGVEKKKRHAKGDFFGMHSAIGTIGRNDDAMSLTDVVLIVFNVKEFETLITKTPKLSLQLMRILSNELRQIHTVTQTVMDSKKELSPEEGLYLYAKCYYEKNEIKKALYVIERYMSMHSNGEHINEIQEMLKDLQSNGT